MLYKNRSLIAAASLLVAAGVPQLALADIVPYTMNFDAPGLVGGSLVNETYGNLGAGQGFHFNGNALIYDVADPLNASNAFGTAPSGHNILTYDCANGDLSCRGITFESNTDIVGIEFDYFLLGGATLNMIVSGTDSTGASVQCKLPSILSQSDPLAWKMSATDCSTNGNGLKSVTFLSAPFTFGLDNITIRTQAAVTGGGGGGNVPEPASLVLAGLGLAGLLATRRGKKA